ncbi:TetR/AcrR family transcriptional regulator [Ktedonospora formicarum]|uniref:TetR family transcriptional regulator n=1 Tax=Ktedonospora formicarum TaxID=2778364 RepID=A0A8J3I170_9CHLR|nr:TetR/AcrR family transcriptional regulator [Ktedonospora formicarum]GHO46911.1 TetR family transcriptional regulator [Ktedonospora formicarum]
MARTAEANQRLREATRAKLLESARRVFARLGRGATMADVAAEAQVSQGLAYRHFASKEELFQTLLEQVVQADWLLPHVLEMPGTPGERLDFLITTVIESRREQPEFYQLFYQLLIDETLPNDLRELVARQSQEFQSMVRQLIVEGQATGEIAKDNPDQLIAALFACLQGLWSGMAFLHQEHLTKPLPDARIVLRLLKPDSEEKERNL